MNLYLLTLNMIANTLLVILLLVGYGRVVLGGPMLATGKELDHWQSMMERPDKEHKLWQHLQPLS